MNLMGKKKKLWFAISLLIIIPGVISLLLYGLKLSIDFTGGSEFTVRGGSAEQTAQVLKSQNIAVVTSVTSGATTDIRTRELSDAEHRAVSSSLSSAGITEEQFQSVGPSISKDITKQAFILVGLASLAIVLYIAYAFRGVAKPASPWRFGVTTIAALLHDVLVLLGAFSLLGHFFGIEIDALFVTATLTVIGFSVHDTIVVFDRIRENLKRYERLSFEEVVNASVVETLARSLNTSLTVLLTLTALLIFGGTSIRNFIAALLIGIASGTFSSVFNASPLLVVWQNYRASRQAKK